MKKYMVMWSVRGRAFVEAENEEEAEERFRAALEGGEPDTMGGGNCDGYEVDDVKEV